MSKVSQKLAVVAILIVVFVVGLLIYLNKFYPKGLQSLTPVKIANKYTGKKIIYINSYHAGYDWSDREQKGAEDTLKNTGIDLKIIYMDAKNNPSEEFSIQAAKKIKAQIEEYKPDVVITADDNAFKYIIKPYYKDDMTQPVVYSGINWNATAYGAPYKNTTGIVEIALIDELITKLAPYAKGMRVGFITADVLSERSNAEYYTKYTKTSLAQTYFVKNFTEWKSKFLQLQNKVDIILLGVSAGITGWDDAQAEQFVMANLKVPTGVEADWMMKYALVGYTKIPNEQGEWAAAAALKIIDGTAPSDIPPTTNTKGNLFVNLNIAKKLNVVIQPDLIKNATVIK